MRKERYVIELLHSTSFASAVTSSKDSLKRIFNIITKYCGKNSAENFLNACDNFDFTTANRILDNTIKELTGYGSISIALSMFANKFAQLLPELDNQVSKVWSESDKVKAIDSYREQIINIIDRKC